MNGLPTKTNGGVRVRSLDRAGQGSAVTPRPAPAQTAQASSGTRVLPVKLLRFPSVREMTGLSRSTIWRLERRGEFPRHHRIAPNVVAWVEEDLIGWIEERTAGRQSA
jgi:prophage regulatory protein